MTSNSLNAGSRIEIRGDKGGLTYERRHKRLCNGNVTGRRNGLPNALINQTFLCDDYVVENAGLNEP